jgi:tripartite motif-containing protein 71
VLRYLERYTADNIFITKWGSDGSENGQFNSPAGIAIDSSGNVYVADSGNNRIQKFTSDGTFITAWGSEGKGNGQFDSPAGIAIDSSNNVYVADFFNKRIQVFAPSK